MSDESDLVRATANLTDRVESLVNVVSATNRQVISLRREVNKKPDDAEVQFITGMAKTQRIRHLKFAIGTSVSCALIAVTISAVTVNHLSYKRCEANARQTRTLVTLLQKVDATKKVRPIQEAISNLNHEKVKC